MLSACVCPCPECSGVGCPADAHPCDRKPCAIGGGTPGGCIPAARRLDPVNFRTGCSVRQRGESCEGCTRPRPGASRSSTKLAELSWDRFRGTHIAPEKLQHQCAPDQRRPAPCRGSPPGAQGVLRDSGGVCRSEGDQPGIALCLGCGRRAIRLPGPMT